jgi:DNA-binding transcriptional ArsR family regulator
LFVSDRRRTKTADAVARLVADGKSVTEIARALKVSKPTVCFHMRKLGIPGRAEFSRRYDWGSVREYYEQGHSATECWERLASAEMRGQTLFGVASLRCIRAWSLWKRCSTWGGGVTAITSSYDWWRPGNRVLRAAGQSTS